MIITPALGFSVSYSSGDGSGAVSSSSSYKLDDSSSLQQQAVLSGSELSQTSQASGTGDNSIANSVGGNGYSLSNEVDSSGSMGVSTSAVATGSGAGISQNAALSGKSGSVSLIASSNKNEMGLASSFSGDSNMNTDLSAVAADRAAMTGTASSAGVPVLEGGELERVASGDIGMSVDGLYLQPSGNLGEFSLNTVNIEKTPASGTPSYLTLANDGGSSGSYRLMGWRWNTQTPNIQWNVKSNAVPTNVGAYNVALAASAAGQTWNAATGKTLFNPSVVYTSSVNTDTGDGKNVIAWKNLADAPGALAYSRTWYNYNKVGGYYSAVESDISLSTSYAWSTSLANGRPYYYGDPIDIQSVLTHEMGHTLGLGDLYGNTPYSGDHAEIMNSYSGVKRNTLGNGDITGIRKLYD